MVCCRLPLYLSLDAKPTSTTDRGTRRAASSLLRTNLLCLSPAMRLFGSVVANAHRNTNTGRIESHNQPSHHIANRHSTGSSGWSVLGTVGHGFVGSCPSRAAGATGAVLVSCWANVRVFGSQLKEVFQGLAGVCVFGVRQSSCYYYRSIIYIMFMFSENILIDAGGTRDKQYI